MLEVHQEAGIVSAISGSENCFAKKIIFNGMFETKDIAHAHGRGISLAVVSKLAIQSNLPK